jgi:general secretion pathway protein D
VRADVQLLGQDAANITYGELLTVLHVHGFTTSEYGGYVTVIPDTGARVMPTPLVSGKETHPDAEFVSAIITVKSIQAAHLVPILRPLLPQSAHLAALPCVNKLVMVDTFANVRRIESLIASLDVGEPIKPGKCEPHSVSEQRSSS